jgi:hypothetical protein
MYVDSGRVIVVVNIYNPIWLWKNFPWQNNSRKTKKKREGINFLYNHQQVKTLTT